MLDNFHSNKLYRVKELTNRVGEVVYKVEAANNMVEAFLGLWKTYAKENETADGAIEQIKSIDKFRLKSSKVVHKSKSEEL